MSRLSTESPAAPWYRHRWPWLLMIGPAAAVLGGVATTWLAITSDDGLVADDYYKRGLEINRTIERGARAEALGLRAIVDVSPNGVAQVSLVGASDDAAAEAASVRLVLSHPTRAGLDAQATLARVSPGRYAGTIRAPAPGRWRVIVESERWRLPAVEVDGRIEGVELRAAQ